MALKKIILFIMALLALSSCGPILNKTDSQVQGGARQFSTTNNQFQAHVQQFEKEGAELLSDSNFKVGDIPINFGDTENKDFDGVCFIYTDGSKEIIIKESWWKQVSDAKKEMMIFHELGHCRLDRDHSEEFHITTNNQSVKLSLMNPILMDSQTWTDFKEGYIAELFSKGQEKLIALFNASNK